MVSTVTATGSVIARVADRLAEAVGQQRYNMWFDQSARFDYDERKRCLRVRVPNRFVADWIGRHFVRHLRDAVAHALGDDVQFDVAVDAGVFDGASTDAAPIQPEPAPARAVAATRRLRHRLEQFIVGPGNELAFTAACQFVEEPSDPTHTLFIHGGCGLGKTHLLQGICRRAAELRPDVRVHYTTAEQFTNEFLSNMRANRTDRFRRRIRGLDLLAVDDVHFLAGKQATQQEFLHSFDEMDLGGARVVLASDSHPKLIHKLSEALVSRCLRGMVVQVDPPDTTTRIRIVRALARQRGLSLVDGVITALANRHQDSVREIEGALTKLHALARLAGERRADGGAEAVAVAPAPTSSTPSTVGHAPECGDPIGHALLHRLVEAEQRDRPSPRVNVRMILEKVSDLLEVSREQIMSQGRSRRVVLARTVVIYLARQMTAMSYPEIAAALGRSNHSSMISAVRRVEARRDETVRVALADGIRQVTLGQLIERAEAALRS